MLCARKGGIMECPYCTDSEGGVQLEEGVCSICGYETEDEWED